MPGSPSADHRRSRAFSKAEWVMKPVKAVLWAHQTSPGLAGKPLALGGHSGGGPASVAAGSYLHRHHGITPKAFVLQHPGAVPHNNLPGCASHHPDESRITPEMPWGGARYAYCSLYYPEDAFSVLATAKVLVTCGTFCEASTYENSNWNLGGSTWVANPSDCMVETYCPHVREAFLDAPRLEGLEFSHCGEHEHGVVGSSGLEQEGVTAVIPWLAAFLPTGGGWRSAAAAISELHGTSTTCVVPGGDRGHGGNEGDKDLLLVEQTGVTRNQQVHPPGPSSSDGSRPIRIEVWSRFGKGLHPDHKRVGVNADLVGATRSSRTHSGGPNSYRFTPRLTVLVEPRARDALHSLQAVPPRSIVVGELAR